MFIVDKDTLQADLIALPMQKFFNFGEVYPKKVKEGTIMELRTEEPPVELQVLWAFLFPSLL